MSDPVLIAIITTGGVILAAIIAGYFSLMSHQEKTYHAVNGRMDELLRVQKELAKRQGIEIGESNQHQRLLNDT